MAFRKELADVSRTLTDKQKDAVYYVIGLEEARRPTLTTTATTTTAGRRGYASNIFENEKTMTGTDNEYALAPPRLRISE